MKAYLSHWQNLQRFSIDFLLLLVFNEIKKLNFGWIGTNARCTLVRSRSLWAQLLKQMICSDRAFSSSLLRAIIVRNHLPFFKVFSNFVHFCPTFQIFCPFLTFFCPFFPLFLKNRTHVLTFWNRPCQSS